MGLIMGVAAVDSSHGSRMVVMVERLAQKMAPPLILVLSEA